MTRITQTGFETKQKAKYVWIPLGFSEYNSRYQVASTQSFKSK